MDEKKPVILIADDSSFNLRILTDCFKNDYEIHTAVSGEEVLRIAAEEKNPDLILLDILMPGMDGFEVCRRLKEMPEIKDIPIIFITSKDREEDEEYGLSLGAIDYITKPFRLPIIRARVKNHLELKKLRDMLRNNSMVDGLTGIANRRWFDESIRREWGRMVRGKQSLSLIMIDIDYFKKYNDTYGHLAGDDCLKQVAVAVKESVNRSGDFVARWGGEEFVCVLPETGKEGAMKIAEQIRQNVMKLRIPHENSPIADVVTVSLGVSTVRPTKEKQLNTLLNWADQALYRSKNNGRNQADWIGEE